MSTGQTIAVVRWTRENSLGARKKMSASRVVAYLLSLLLERVIALSLLQNRKRRGRLQTSERAVLQE